MMGRGTDFITTKRMDFSIDELTETKLRIYCERLHTPMSRVVNEALERFLPALEEIKA
jgi:hypothetical protein